MTAKEKLENAGYEDVVIFSDYSYDDALIGVTTNNQAVYDFDKMVEWLIAEHNFSETDAIEWIEYNTLRALPYMGSAAPIIIYSI